MIGLEDESRSPHPDVVPNVRKGRVALGPATDIPILNYHSLLFRIELAPALRPEVRIVQIIGVTAIVDLMINGIEYVVSGVLRFTPCQTCVNS